MASGLLQVDPPPQSHAGKTGEQKQTGMKERKSQRVDRADFSFCTCKLGCLWQRSTWLTMLLPGRIGTESQVKILGVALDGGLDITLLGHLESIYWHRSLGI